jgi:hypothetical protein
MSLWPRLLGFLDFVAYGPRVGTRRGIPFHRHGKLVRSSNIAMSRLIERIDPRRLDKIRWRPSPGRKRRLVKRNNGMKTNHQHRRKHNNREPARNCCYLSGVVKESSLQVKAFLSSRRKIKKIGWNDRRNESTSERTGDQRRRRRRRRVKQATMKCADAEVCVPSLN